MGRKRRRRRRAAAAAAARQQPPAQQQPPTAKKKRRVVIGTVRSAAETETAPAATAASETLLQLCWRGGCGEWWTDRGGRHCRRCDDAVYCSRECRDADRGEHYAICGDNSERTLAKLFVAKVKQPRLARWLQRLAPPSASGGVLYAACRPGQDGVACTYWSERELALPQKDYLRDKLVPAARSSRQILVEALIKPVDRAQALPGGWWWWQKEIWLSDLLNSGKD